MASFTDARTAERFAGDVCFPSAPLLADRGRNPSVPDHAHFCGPCVIESWSGTSVYEAFHHGIDSVRRRMKPFADQCWAVHKDTGNPKSLRDAAREVVDMARRSSEQLDGLEFSVRKEMDADNVWVMVPADWTRCVTDRRGARDERIMKLPSADLWLDAMHQAISLHRIPTALMPIIPNFDDKPFAAAVAFGDPTGMSTTFDSRYFMSTTEFNLLNLILHSD
jgi:hypothetical protein